MQEDETTLGCAYILKVIIRVFEYTIDYVFQVFPFFLLPIRIENVYKGIFLHAFSVKLRFRLMAKIVGSWEVE